MPTPKECWAMIRRMQAWSQDPGRDWCGACLCGDHHRCQGSPEHIAEYALAVEAVAKLHHPVEMKVMAVACFQEDCDHDDSDGCEAACVPTMCCAHCTSLREETAFYEEADYAVQPWPCPTATAARIDGSGGGDVS